MTSLRRRTLTLLCAVPSVLASTLLLPAAASAITTPLGSSFGQLVNSAGISHPGLDRLLAEGTPDKRAIVTFASKPTAAQISALRALGLVVQPMKTLPLTIVQGTVEEMTSVISSGIAEDIYPDEKIQLLDTASTDSMSTSAAAGDALRKSGFTGKGITVGVVDSGCDATQPDLAKRVTKNVKLISPEYANQGAKPTLVIPVDMGPYSNSDIGGGHGTHVAGIIAADSSSATDGSRFGAAPDANLACFSIGEALFTTAVVTAYDYILSDPDMFGIDVINNSWGNSYRQFDPSDPVAVATKAVYDRGATVVFAAGNSGGNDVSASLNPFSQSPWVVSVAAGTVERLRADFSSNGFINDNSEPTKISPNGHSTFLGDRIGLVHPDVTAPGVNISSTCNPTGSVVGGCLPGKNTTASGTSMASPAVAGAAAVLLQAQPLLTPDEVRLALQASATPVAGEAAPSENSPTGDLPLWEVGYGFVNLDAAVSLVQGKDWQTNLAAAATEADARVLAANGDSVSRADFFSFAAPTATAGGSDNHTFGVPVGAAVTALQVTLAHPSGGTVGVAVFKFTVNVLDPSGDVVATAVSDPNAGSGTASVRVDIARLQLTAGMYSFQVIGNYAASDPDTLDSDSTLGRSITLHIAQLDH